MDWPAVEKEIINVIRCVLIDWWLDCLRRRKKRVWNSQRKFVEYDVKWDGSCWIKMLPVWGKGDWNRLDRMRFRIVSLPNGDDLMSFWVVKIKMQSCNFYRIARQNGSCSCRKRGSLNWVGVLWQKVIVSSTRWDHLERKVEIWWRESLRKRWGRQIWNLKKGWGTWEQSEAERRRCCKREGKPRQNWWKRRFLRWSEPHKFCNICGQNWLFWLQFTGFSVQKNKFL